MSPARLGRSFGGGLVLGLVAGFVLLVMGPVLMGWRPYTVLTGSMRPVIAPGDVVMAQPIVATSMKIGDVVTFNDATRGGAVVTHRVVSLIPAPGRVDVETRGDANTGSERWSVPADGTVGRVVFVIPKVGHVGQALRRPLGILLVVILPVLAIGALTVRKIWTAEDEDDAESDAGR